MPLTPNGLVDTLSKYQKKLADDGADATEGLKYLADACNEYFSDNTTVSFSWVALMPPPASTPDPVTSFTTSDVTFNFSFVMPGHSVDTPLPVMKAGFGMEFMAGVNTALISTSPQVLTPPAMFLAPAPLVLENTFPYDREFDIEESNLSLANQLINYVKSAVNPIPFPGINGSFTVPSPGATMLSIS